MISLELIFLQEQRQKQLQQKENQELMIIKYVSFLHLEKSSYSFYRKICISHYNTYQCFIYLFILYIHSRLRMIHMVQSLHKLVWTSYMLWRKALGDIIKWLSRWHIRVWILVHWTCTVGWWRVLSGICTFTIRSRMLLEKWSKRSGGSFRRRIS